MFDAVVLAGGTARRLGGASKPDVRLGGRRLLDHALAATTGGRRVVVVAPEDVAVPDGVLHTLEDPPYGGPVAGIAAGLATLGDGAAPWVLVLACDVPHAGSAVPRLRSAVTEGAQGADGAVLVDAEDRPQWLAALYRTAALHERLGEHPGGSVRALVSGLDLRHVRAAATEAADVDTWADLAALEE
ncbi:molybdopterin-guanine dinucleotide biosynthesis protein A [Georgenia soli]|uniref:Molybdopterin-guanine dinucleotide biosynthesis protein A n=1 Tax=Georgenia soli TaxID=638953 RepID=A0A2A9EM26_9MICO|nr:NTP transferase domain-containing protein [Georgenia soli]PFG39312.1 molybdopterin-guanine dinucleotide biosynthesis protein A [Georgenia soli]